MEIYYIIDSLGVQHGTVKATSDIEAINIYKGDMPQFIEYIIIAVRPKEIKQIVENLTNLK